MRELSLLLFALLGVIIDSVSSICPPVCTCDIDIQGRKRTRCEGGGLSIPGSFDIGQLDADVEIFIVSGLPGGQKNHFVLGPNTFQNRRFKEVHLSYSDMEMMGARAFSGLESTLQVLNLTWNSLQMVTELNFKNLSRLTHLHLDHNRISTVYSAMFVFLERLKVLTLSDNRIRDVPPRMGLSLSNLELLDLSSNPLGEVLIQNERPAIPEAFFSDFKSLKTVLLRNTSLDVLPWKAIQASNLNLEEIDMSNNRLPELRANELSLLRNLRRVKLAGNPIRQIQPGALRGLYLESLDLSGLPSTVLSPGVFMEARIVRLDVSNMGLNVLNRDVFLPISQDLLVLNISENAGIPMEPRLFELLPKLKELTMKRMLKTELPADFFSYQNEIEALDLSENGLIDLDDKFFEPLPALTRLNLASNQLNRVPPALSSLPRIQEIDLYDNRLTAFPDTLAMTFANPSSPIKSLRLNKNPWNCDCSVASLGRWLTRQDGHNGYAAVCQGNANFTCPVCQTPENLKGLQLNKLEPQFLDTCTPPEARSVGSNANVDVIIAVVVCLIVLIIAVLLLVLWYRNRLHSYRTYEEKRKDNEIFEQNGDVEVFAEEPGPISKPKNTVPGIIPAGGVAKSQTPKAESDV